MTGGIDTAIAHAFRAEYGRAVSVLIRRFGDIDLAEEAVQEAFAIALRQWPTQGVPPSPAGWIITTARRRAIDRLRREASRDAREQEAALLHAPANPPDQGGLEDDRLRLIFTCCHPALAPAARIALTLRLVGGLTTGEIARAFLTSEPTMAQRITRAKAKIRDARIPYRVPDSAELPRRVSGVLAVLYLIFNEGYVATEGEQLGRVDLAEEAIRLARLVVVLMPDEPEALGLLALMLLIDSRRAARTDSHGDLVPLAEQRRALWNDALIGEGLELVRRCRRLNRPGPYQLQAAIQAVHAAARTHESVDWPQIVALYDHLISLRPHDNVARLNRAVAVAEVSGPAEGLRIVDELPLDGQHLFHAIRGDLLHRLGRLGEARTAYAKALSLTHNDVEKRHLARRMASV